MIGTVFCIALGLALWLYVPGLVKLKSARERKIFRFLCMILGIVIAAGSAISYIKSLF